MNEQVCIEKMEIGDVAAVAALLNTLVPWDITAENTERSYRKLMNNQNCSVFVAKEQGRIIGTATAICCSNLAAEFLVIEDVVVAPGCTGRGIGSMLMAAADSFAREKHCKYAILVSSGHRTNAHRFYQKCGFVEDVRGFRKGYSD